MTYSVMSNGIELPSDLVRVEMATGQKKCLMYLHPKVAGDEVGWAKLMRGYVEGNIPLSQFFSDEPEMLVATTGFPASIPVRIEPAEQIFHRIEGLSAWGSCFVAHSTAYSQGYPLLSFVYAAVPLSAGGIQEFSRDLVVPKKTPIPDGCYWQLLLAVEPLPDLVQS